MELTLLDTVPMIGYCPLGIAMQLVCVHERAFTRARVVVSCVILELR